MSSNNDEAPGLLVRLRRLVRPARKDRPKVRRTAQETALDYAKTIGSAVLIALVIRQVWFQPFRIPTGSMLETLQIGDFLFVDMFLYGPRTPERLRLLGHTFADDLPVLKLPGFREPRQGDIIVFQYPEDLNVDYIKRCVAVEGDRVEVREGVTYVNGEIYESNFGDRDGDHSCVPSWTDPESCPPPRVKKDQAGYVSRGVNREFHLAEELNRRGRQGDAQGFVMMAEAALKADVGLDREAVLPHLQALAAMGQRLSTEFATHANAVIAAAQAADAPVVVPEGHIFMMGDNRYNSADSRYWGPLDKRWIKGKAVFIYFSWDLNFHHAPKWSRIGDIVR